MEDMGTIVTLCRREQCPILPTVKQLIHWPLPDPAAAPDEDLDEAFRACRDELLRRLPSLIGSA